MPEKDNYQVPLSLCIPTNGVVDWVEPVLKSIYTQDVAEDVFEVVVTDNGDNADFYDMMQSWCAEHNNIRYRKTTAQGFFNQIECFRDADGEYIKFVNHRMMLQEGALQHLLEFITANHKNKPICYFLNGCLSLPEISQYDDFDDFVRALSYYSSWSAGLGVWKTDFTSFARNHIYNKLFPHTDMLLHNYTKRCYIIDNYILMKSLPENHPKGKYNLFYAFAVEYPGIINDLYRKGDISVQTLLHVKKYLLNFLADLYIDYCILHKSCSYELSGVWENVDVYFCRDKFLLKIILRFTKRAIKKIFFH